MRPIKLSKTKITVAAILVVLVVCFILLPAFILNRLNDYLAEFSPAAALHIETLHLHPLSASYVFGGLTMQSKTDHTIFCKVKTIDVSLAWRELLNGKISTDIETDTVDMYVDKNIYDLAESGGQKSHDKPKFISTKEDALRARNTLFPLQVTRLTLAHSSFAFADKLKLPFEEQVRLTNINGMITDLTPTSADKASHCWLKGRFMETAEIRIACTAYLKESPKEWDADLEMRHLPLNSMNGFLKRVGPLTFNGGHMDVFAELKSEKGTMEGYVKPFLHQVDIVGNKKDFFSVKHFFVETFAAMLELVFVSSKTDTIATKIPISQNKQGGVVVDKDKALAGAFHHAYAKEYTPQIEDSITLTKEKKK